MKLLNGQVFATNYERAGAFYESTCAPCENDEGRKAVRNLMIRIYQAFAEKSEEIGLKTVPDVSFNAWEKQKGRENDVKTIRDANSKILDFADMFLSFVEKSEETDNGLAVGKKDIKLKKYFFKVLESADIKYTKGDEIIIELDDKCKSALKELAVIAGKESENPDGSFDRNTADVIFSRAVFNPQSDWLCDSLDNILGADGSLKILCEELSKRGYERKIWIDGRRLSLNYVKDYGKKPQPLKIAWGERTHLGIEISYEDLWVRPATLWLRLPYFTDILTNADKLSKKAKSFVINQTKTCDGCHYCVQTDKTGKRPLAAIKVEGKNKCPYFPGFNFNFTEADKDLIDNIIQLLDELSAYFDAHK